MMGMTNDPFLDTYLKLCQETCDRMQRDGTWPWVDDSQNSENLIESEDNPDSE